MSDTFRKNYKALPEELSKLILDTKNKAEELEALMTIIKNREMSLALTNLEQSMMWSTKAIALYAENNDETKSDYGELSVRVEILEHKVNSLEAINRALLSMLEEMKNKNG